MHEIIRSNDVVLLSFAESLMREHARIAHANLRAALGA